MARLRQWRQSSSSRCVQRVGGPAASSHLVAQEWLGFEKHSVRVTLEAPFLVPDILIGPAALHPVGRSVPFQGPAVAPGFRPVVRRDPIGGNEYTSDMRARVPPRSIVGQVSFS